LLPDCSEPGIRLKTEVTAHVDAAITPDRLPPLVSIGGVPLTRTGGGGSQTAEEQALFDARSAAPVRMTFGCSSPARAEPSGEQEAPRRLVLLAAMVAVALLATWLAFALTRRQRGA